MEEIIQECPRLKIAVGHFGMVTLPDWKEQIKLARHPNVMIESGGITWLFNDEFYPFKGAIKAIREAAELVGMEKLMWGSDYPRTITAITYKMSYDFVVKSLELSEVEKTLFPVSYTHLAKTDSILIKIFSFKGIYYFKFLIGNDRRPFPY